MELLMETIDTNAEKITKMHEYIGKCRAVLSATEDAEVAKRLRQYWSASNNRQIYLEKIRELEEEAQKTAKARARNNGLTFIVAILAGFAIHYLELIDRSNQTIFFIGLAVYVVIKELATQLDANNYTLRREGWKQQVDFYKHEMSCSGGGYVEYEDKYLESQNSDDVESKKVIRELFFSSVEIAILHGLKSKVQSVKF
jgi:hypothetical protein